MLGLTNIEENDQRAGTYGLNSNNTFEVLGEKKHNKIILGQILQGTPTSKSSR